MSQWTYNPFRAMLVRDGRNFAIVTPDGKNALSKVDERLMLDALNGGNGLVVTAPDTDDARQKELGL